MSERERQQEAGDGANGKGVDPEQARPQEQPGGGRRAKRRWPRWLAMVLLGLVILGSGIVIGSVGTLVVVRRGIIRAIKHPEEIPERTIRRMARRYDLSEQQQAEVREILRRRLHRIAAIRQRLRPHLDAELDSLREEVAQVLTEEQEQQWREDFSRLRDAVQVPMYAPHAPPEEPAEGSPPQ